ncbi:Putative serine protease HtrA [Aureliella helgolandensis]|uniref:Serine protease HtrA n=2 Tax=Aureliella helgolandensis TaxID=2527968 RepID=A0A518G0U2_9BACT|nr:Putative serine protease HtrA [Aureliella helgolandensis]
MIVSCLRAIALFIGGTMGTQSISQPLIPSSTFDHSTQRSSPMEINSVNFRLPSCLGLLLLAAVTSLTTASVQADDAIRKGTREKTTLVSVAMESSLEGLPKLYQKVSESIVRIETADKVNKTGVIVSSDGHIVVRGGARSDEVKVHLIDGRTVTAKPAGWSVEWNLGVMKIKEEGSLKAIQLGSTKDLKAGEPCLVIGYTPRGDTKFDSSPTARFGFIDRSVPNRWFTTTCFPGFFEDAAVIDMDGRLLGIDTGRVNDQSYVTAVEKFLANRDELFAGKNLDWIRYPPNPDSIYRINAGDHPEMLRGRKTEDVLGPVKTPASMADAKISKAKEIAKESTVRLISKDRLAYDGVHYDRWSGVIVSEDGYILTCGHTSQLPGERVTVCLSDGRDLDAVTLGTNPISDVGLVKITSTGSWPFAEIADTSSLNPGDPLVACGYPAIDGPSRQFSTARTPLINSTAVKIPSYFLWSPELVTEYFNGNGGMSGGGIFNQNGQYVAVLNNLAGGVRSEVAKVQWDDLKQVESIDTATGLPHPLRRRFVAQSKAVAQSVVEVLVDSKPVSIGTIVDAGGWILTKASALDGEVSCRLADGSIVDADKRAESQENDLALLKIEVVGLVDVEFSDNEPPSMMQILCGVGPDQVLQPGIVSIQTRAIPPEPAWTGDSTVDTQDGVKIIRLGGGWRNKINLSTEGTKLERNDIIVSINAHATPNIARLTQILASNFKDYCTGDLVSIALLRKGAPMEVRTPLPRASVENSWMIGKHDSPRRSGFNAVFDTDIQLLLHEVGCPVIDVEGRIRGIAIASRGRTETQRGPTSVLPSRVIARVTKQLMAEANSKGR